MMFTEAERAEIGAELRKLSAEGKDRVHILTARGGWRVVREGRRRGKAFKIKDEAVAYGRDLAKRLQKDLVIHTKDGDLEARESFGPGKVLGRSGR
ncbi:MAG TPA: DUF2188 domain-containing protein [Thermoanaerobaculia bacterium]|nr:DUF2188 domain-containing protein [Thermoanaerobaculia bacterium]